MNPDHARALLTAELEELGDRAKFAAASAAESASGDLSAPGTIGRNGRVHERHFGRAQWLVPG